MHFFSDGLAIVSNTKCYWLMMVQWSFWNTCWRFVANHGHPFSQREPNQPFEERRIPEWHRTITARLVLLISRHIFDNEAIWLLSLAGEPTNQIRNIANRGYHGQIWRYSSHPKGQKLTTPAALPVIPFLRWLRSRMINHSSNEAHSCRIISKWCHTRTPFHAISVAAMARDPWRKVRVAGWLAAPSRSSTSISGRSCGERLVDHHLSLFVSDSYHDMNVWGLSYQEWFFTLSAIISFLSDGEGHIS